MLEAARNSIFSVFSNYMRVSSQTKFLSVNPKNPDQVAKKFRMYKEAKALHLAEKNVMSASQNQLNEFEKKEFQILSKYWDEGHVDPLVDPQYVREQLDIIQITKNLKMIEANLSDYDPEYVHFERLKAKFLLEEPGAKEEFVEYVKTRPYLRPYLKWADQAEQNHRSLWVLF